MPTTTPTKIAAVEIVDALAPEDLLVFVNSMREQSTSDELAPLADEIVIRMNKVLAISWGPGEAPYAPCVFCGTQTSGVRDSRCSEHTCIACWKALCGPRVRS